MLLELSEYDLEVNYKPGKQMYIADTLSRNYVKEQIEPLLTEKYKIASIGEQIAISSTQLQQIKKATENDSEMKLLREIVLKVRPNSRKQVPDPMKIYWNFKDDICLIDGGC